MSVGAILSTSGADTSETWTRAARVLHYPFRQESHSHLGFLG